MNMDEFKELFIEEAKKSITEIENNLILLKENYDENVMLNLKRQFHTLKGNSASMGYDNFFELSKSLNDLSCQVIDKKLEFNLELLTLFDSAKNVLLDALDEIKNDNLTNFNDNGLTKKIQNMLY
ncbi:MAG: Hpt domain-containing protein [Nanoarchaeota archaeon]